VTDENRKAAIDYERTWVATAEVSDAAFAELEPLVARVVDHIKSAGWAPDDA